MSFPVVDSVNKSNENSSEEETVKKDIKSTEKSEKSEINNEQKEKINPEKIKGRWNNLYLDSKIQKLKKEEYKKKEQEKREKDMLSECSFTPKIYKNNKNFKKNNNFQFNNVIHQHAKDSKKTMDDKKYLKNDQELYKGDIIQRNDYWNKKKDSKIKEMQQKKIDEEKEICRRVDTDLGYRGCTNIGANAENIVDDPESYQVFILRQKNKREQDLKKQKIQDYKPGGGKLWDKLKTKNKNNILNYNYDYTKHIYTNREYTNQNNLSCSYLKKIQPNTPSPRKIALRNNKSSEKFRFDKDKFYSYLYSNSRNSDYNLINNQSNNNNNIFSKFTDKIEYGTALEILHKELFNFDLSDEEDNE